MELKVYTGFESEVMNKGTYQDYQCDGFVSGNSVIIAVDDEIKALVEFGDSVDPSKNQEVSSMFKSISHVLDYLYKVKPAGLSDITIYTDLEVILDCATMFVNKENNFRLQQSQDGNWFRLDEDKIRSIVDNEEVLELLWVLYDMLHNIMYSYPNTKVEFVKPDRSSGVIQPYADSLARAKLFDIQTKLLESKMDADRRKKERESNG